MIRALVFALMTFGCVSLHAATYPPNEDYGDQGDFIIKVGTEFGRTADLTLIGPILANFPEGPGTTEVGLPEVRFEDTVWDLSDLRNPTMIRSLTCDGCYAAQPIAAHATAIRFMPGIGPLLWAGGDWLLYDPDGATSNDQIILTREEDYPQLVGVPGPLSYPMMFSPYHARSYWDYGFNPEGSFAIRDPSQFLPADGLPEYAYLGDGENYAWLGVPFVDWDHLGLTGVTGFPSWSGNLLVVASDQQSTGIAIYDTAGFKDGVVPRLLSIFNPILEEPEVDGEVNRIGIGGYWMEPYGTNKMVWAARERGELTPIRRKPAMFVVDYTDPTNPFLSCEIYFDRDTTQDWDGDGSSDPMYVNFQDEYAFVDHFKVNIEACETAYEDGEITQEELQGIIYKFDDISNGCDASQYFRPLGQVGIFGGYDFWVTPDVNEQGMCFFVTDDEPDTRPPFISGHRPLAGATNYPVDGFIHLHIPETLRTETVMDAITVTNLDTDTPISFVHQLSHTGTISVWPDSDLAENTSYEVSVSGIQDFMGNTMDPYSFTFSTGDSVIIIETPPPQPVQTPTPSYSGTPYYPNKSSQLTCESDQADGDVWVVNPDNDSVAIIQRETDATTLETTHTLINEVHLNYEAPTSVARVNDVYVVTHRDDDKVVVYDVNGLPLRAVDTGYGTQPIAAVTNGSFVFVSLYGSGEVIAIDASDWEIDARVAVGPTPKAMALHNDRLLVTRFISNGEYGEIYDLDVSSSLALTRTIQVNKVLVPDDDDNGSGVPNYLSSIVVSEDGALAYVTGNKVNIDRGHQRSGEPLDGDNTVRPIIAIIDLANNQDANVDPATRSGSLDLDNGADPSGVIFLADPDIRVHSLRGNGIVVANDLANNRSAQFSVGAAPQEMCGTLRTLYVKNFADRTVSIIDVADFMFDGSQNPDIETLSTVNNEVLTGQQRLGLEMFYASLIPEMGPEGYMSCSSCHFDGGQDGMVWDISSLGEGFRNTISLNGASGTRFGNLHWSSNFDEVQDFELQMEALNEGEGLIEGRTFNGQSPLDETTSLRDVELDALAAYIESLGQDSVSRSPFKTYTGELTAAAQRGRTIFYEDNCEQCHAGTAFRDGQSHDVGTISPTSGSRLGGALTAIRTPTLVELFATAPYFHDGSAATLADVLDVGVHERNLSAQDEADLIEFLLSLDREDFIGDNELFVPGEPPNMADLVISGGSGGGRYAVGDLIEISAGEPPEGEIFLGWTGDVETVTDVNATDTTVTITSEDMSVTANFGPDEVPPSAPSNLVVSDVSNTNAMLTWTGSTDNVAVTEYAVLIDGSEAERTTDTTLRVFGLSSSTTYAFTIVAYDEAGNASLSSNEEEITTPAPSGVSELSGYFFGHSLVYHTVTSYRPLSELGTPYWVGQFAQANGQVFATDGQFRTSDYRLPPEPQWGFDDTSSAWTGDFADSNYDSVIFTEVNFTQGVPPGEGYDGTIPGTPVNSTLRILDYARQEEPGITFYIYENWPDAGTIMPSFDGTGPVSSSQVAAYHELTTGSFHDWWIELHDTVSAVRTNVKMVPVGPIISGILTEIPGASEIPFEALYEDNAPHGRPTIYFLAGMIQYSAMYQQQVPSIDVPDSIHPAVAANYQTIADYIWAELQAFNFPDGSSRVW